MHDGQDIGDLEALAETERALEAESEDRGEAEYAFGLEFAENLEPATPSPKQFETPHLDRAGGEEDRRAADVPEKRFINRAVDVFLYYFFAAGFALVALITITIVIALAYFVVIKPIFADDGGSTSYPNGYEEQCWDGRGNGPC